MGGTGIPTRGYLKEEGRLLDLAPEIRGRIVALPTHPALEQLHAVGSAFGVRPDQMGSNYQALTTHVQRVRDFDRLAQSPATAANPLTMLEKMYETYWTFGDTSGIRAWARACTRRRAGKAL